MADGGTEIAHPFFIAEVEAEGFPRGAPHPERPIEPIPLAAPQIIFHEDYIAGNGIFPQISALEILIKDNGHMLFSLSLQGAHHDALDEIALNKGIDEEDGHGGHHNGGIFQIFGHHFLFRCYPGAIL